VSTPNILSRKSEEGPLPHCKTRAEMEGFNRLDPLVGDIPNIRKSYWYQNVTVYNLSILPDILSLPTKINFLPTQQTLENKCLKFNVDDTPTQAVKLHIYLFSLQ
jgi:hypothetical protein